MYAEYIEWSLTQKMKIQSKLMVRSGGGTSIGLSVGVVGVSASPAGEDNIAMVCSGVRFPHANDKSPAYDASINGGQFGIPFLPIDYLVSREYTHNVLKTYSACRLTVGSSYPIEGGAVVAIMRANDDLDWPMANAVISDMEMLDETASGTSSLPEIVPEEAQEATQ